MLRMSVKIGAMAHPCISCGACCAYYRVSFHWREGSDVMEDGVPLETCMDWNSTLRVMRGTQTQPIRCHQLQGRIGETVMCVIYQQRPSPCRDLWPSFEHGQPNEQCDRARKHHGLSPLTESDWEFLADVD